MIEIVMPLVGRKRADRYELKIHEGIPTSFARDLDDSMIRISSCVLLVKDAHLKLSTLAMVYAFE